MKGSTCSLEMETSPGTAKLALFEAELWPRISEHRTFAPRFSFCDSSLRDVPMFHENSVLHPHDVHNNERRTVSVRVPAVDHHKVALRHDHAVIPLGVSWECLDKPEEPIASGRNVAAVLDVVGRPQLSRLCEVALVEQDVKSFNQKRLIFFWESLRHNFLLQLCRSSHTWLTQPRL